MIRNLSIPNWDFCHRGKVESLISPGKVSCDTRSETGVLRPQKPLRRIRDEEVGGREFLYLTPTRYTVTTRMVLHEGGQLCEPF